MTITGILPPLDLSQLPVPDVVEALSFEEIKAQMLADYVARNPGASTLESDPAVKVIETCAYRALLIYQRINDAARETYLAEASGTNLDAIGALFNVARLEGESDDRFRKRVQLGLVGFGSAGPRRAYQYHALSVSADIVDVGVHSPSAGEVTVTVLAPLEKAVEDTAEEERAIGVSLFDQPADTERVVVLMPASDPVMDAIRARLNAEDVRPMTDYVVVTAPELVPFVISARLVIYPGPDASTVLAAAKKALAGYLRAIRLVGYDAARSGIIAALNVPGVQNVLLDSPTSDVPVMDGELAVCVDAAVTIEGTNV